ncbi:MAG TPA: WYL domain-containing protein [Spirochaetia bacterium]|nr:WYL domain-containing protein [Spirochaetia bacterium]
MSQLERVVFIDQRIKNHNGIRIRDITEHFEISERQAKRDIEYLRDRFDAPIVWNREKGCYIYSAEYRDLDFLDERSLLFYVFARAAAGTLAYVPVAAQQALDHLLTMVSKDLRPLAEAVMYDLPGFEPVDEEILPQFLHAILDKTVIDAVYKDAEGKESSRGIEPLKIINYSGTWYCVAFDHANEDLRTFRLSRFVRVSLSKKKWRGTVRAEEIERFIDSSYGMFKGVGDKLATVRFFGWARKIVEGEIWHTDQNKIVGIDDKKGPYIQIEVPVSRWEEILGRTLRFGSMAEVVEPPEFRSLWIDEIKRMAETAGLTE